MFSLFIVLVSFSESSTRDRRKCLILNDEPCIVSPTLIDMNPVEFKYYLFMISLNKCSGSCNVLYPKLCDPKEIKDIYAKAFNMVTNKNEPKEMTEHVSCDFKGRILAQMT